MPIKPKSTLRPAKRIAPKTLKNMRDKTAVIKDFKKLVDGLGKPMPKELEDAIDKSRREINTPSRRPKKWI